MISKTAFIFVAMSVSAAMADDTITCPLDPSNLPTPANLIWKVVHPGTASKAKFQYASLYTGESGTAGMIHCHYAGQLILEGDAAKSYSLWTASGDWVAGKNDDWKCSPPPLAAVEACPFTVRPSSNGGNFKPPQTLMGNLDIVHTTHLGA